MPERIQLRRTKGWRMPPNTVKVDRSTKWGNPFWVERKSGLQWDPFAAKWHLIWELRHFDWVRGPTFATKEDAIGQAVMRFACEVAPLWDLSELQGKNLACWCERGALCHADVLLELANPAPTPLPRAEKAGL